MSRADAIETIEDLQKALRQKERDNEFLRLENARLARKLIELDRELDEIQRDETTRLELLDRYAAECGQ